MNYTFKFDPQQEWGSVVNESYPLDYEDHFYVSIKPWSVEMTDENIGNLLNTTASLELAMYYLDLYEYEAPDVEVEEESTSQAVQLFWMLIGLLTFYQLVVFLYRRRKRICSFLAGMIMPSAEFRYREY
jgi:hypothetical protein